VFGINLSKNFTVKRSNKVLIIDCDPSFHFFLPTKSIAVLYSSTFVVRYDSYPLQYLYSVGVQGSLSVYLC
jgi:hypothetical protein